MILPRSILAAVLGSTLLHAEIVFQFDYSQSAEFNHPSLGAARRAALESAAAWLGAYFENDATLQIEVFSQLDTGTDFLAFGGSFPSPASTGFSGILGQVAERKVITGVDANGPGFGTNPDGSPRADGCVEVNFGIPWDLDDSVDPNRFDFKSTIIHELMHVLGWLCSVFEDGTDFYFTEPGDPGVWVPFDQFVAGPTGTPVIDTSFVLDLTAWDTHRVGGASPSAGLFFAGPHAMAANGGQPAGLYTPGAWLEGSSVSHLDDDNPAFNDSLMLSGVGPGPSVRQLSPLEIAIMRDLGYTMKDFALGIAREGTSVTLTVDGPPGTWPLSLSGDLANWGPAGEVTITPPATTGMVVVPSAAAAAYYRIGAPPTAPAPPAAPPPAPARWRR